MKKKKLSIAQQIALSFFGVILVGSILLTLPFAQTSTSTASYIDNLFISVSAVCVTGLFTHSIASSYNTFGQTVIMIMIQIGGLGLMTIISYFLLSTGKKMSFSDTVVASEALNKDGIHGFRQFIRSILKYTFVIELIGALIFMTVLIPRFGLGKGIFNSIFLAVSAFCNAGFDTWSHNSLLEYVHHPVINYTIAALIIIGGIGFAVWFDLTRNASSLIKNKTFTLKKFVKKLKVHTKLAISITLIVIGVGTLLGIIIEYNNPTSIGNFSFGDKFMAAFFQTVTMRTAGFATLDYTLMKPISVLIYSITMFIGGSPGGTAGGIKTTTMSLVLLMVVAEYRNRKNINIFHHTVNPEMIRKALIVFVSFLIAAILGISAILIFDPHVSLLAILFEVASALNTVGVSMNLTPILSRGSHIVLMLLMFGGRIGPMTLLLSLTKTEQRHVENTYSEAKILIG